MELLGQLIYCVGGCAFYIGLFTLAIRLFHMIFGG